MKCDWHCIVNECVCVGVCWYVWGCKYEKAQVWDWVYLQFELRHTQLIQLRLLSLSQTDGHIRRLISDHTREVTYMETHQNLVLFSTEGSVWPCDVATRHHVIPCRGMVGILPTWHHELLTDWRMTVLNIYPPGSNFAVLPPCLLVSVISLSVF